MHSDTPEAAGGRDPHASAPEDPTGDPLAEAHRSAAHAADRLTTRLGIGRADLAVVLGSGWSGGRNSLGEVIGRCPMAELPGFSEPVVAGHGGEALAVRTAAGRTALLFTGRTHLYEGRGVDPVVHAVRTAAAAGAGVLVLTNGCGSLQPGWGPGTPVMLRDHINLTGVSPLRGPLFVDMTEAYSPRLRAAVRTIRPAIPEGVYVQFRGPQYETPAEVEMARRVGGDLVGMSTAVETIAAREAGMEVLGLSLVTNLAAGVAHHPLDHAEVLAAGRAAEPVLQSLLADLMEVL